MSFAKPVRPLLAALALATLTTAAAAGSFQVDPVKVEITANRRIAGVRIKNQADHPVTIRNYALSWTQRNGEDVQAEVSSLVISPPIVTIPPGGVQLVRIGLRSVSTPPASYRLIVEEVPEANPGTGIQVALRLSIPLFAMQKAGALTDLSWAAWQRGDGRWIVEATNNGPGYVRIENSDASQQTGLGFGPTEMLGTVLPMSSRRWVLQTQPSILDRRRFERIARGKRHDNVQTVSTR